MRGSQPPSRPCRSSNVLSGHRPEHPARGKCRWEGEAQRRARTLRSQYANFEQGRDDAAGLTLVGADDVGGVGARKFAAVEHAFEDAT